MNKITITKALIEIFENLRKIRMELDSHDSQEISAVAAEVSSKPVTAQLELTCESGRSWSCWPSSEWSKPTGKVIEVTGKQQGKYMPSKWFKNHEAGRREALRYLKTLDQGNTWLSEAWTSCGELRTGKRVRINLNHPHSV